MEMERSRDGLQGEERCAPEMGCGGDGVVRWKGEMGDDA